MVAQVFRSPVSQKHVGTNALTLSYYASRPQRQVYREPSCRLRHHLHRDARCLIHREDGIFSPSHAPHATLCNALQDHLVVVADVVAVVAVRRHRLKSWRERQ